MSDHADAEDGARASTKIQTLIMGLLEQGLDPKAIAVATCGIGAAMLTRHYGVTDAVQIGHGLVDSASRGELPLTPALTAANANPKR